MREGGKQGQRTLHNTRTKTDMESTSPIPCPVHVIARVKTRKARHNKLVNDTQDTKEKYSQVYETGRAHLESHCTADIQVTNGTVQCGGHIIKVCVNIMEI